MWHISAKTVKQFQKLRLTTKSVDEKNLSVLKSILGVITLVYFTTMYYVDNPVIFGTAYKRVEYLFQGNVMDFLFDWSPIVPYGVLCQMLFTVWVIPIKILSWICGIPLQESIGAYLWYKLLITLLWGLCVRETQKIAVTLRMDAIRVQWIGLFLSSSLLAFLPVFHLAQVDVVYLVFMLWGVRRYIEGDYKGFIVAFLLANPVKYLSIFVYVPLIFFKEKRIFYILRDILIGLILIPVEVLIKNMTSVLCWIGIIEPQQIKVPYVLASSQIRALLTNTWGAGPDNMAASMVVIIYTFICIVAYCSCDKDERKGKLSIWLCFSSIAVLVIFGTMKCYWIILMAPFIILLLFMEQHNIRINFVMEAVASISIIGVYVITQSEVFGGRMTFDYLLFSFNRYLMNRRASHETRDMIHYIKDTFQYPGEYENAVSALVIVSVITLIAVNFPYRRYEDKAVTVEEQTEWHQWGCIRVGILILWFLLNFWCLFR